MHIGKVIGLFAVLLSTAGLAAEAPPPPAVYPEYMEVSARPDVAERRKFLAYLLHNWDYRLDSGKDKNLCAGALAEMTSDPSIEFLDPDVFDAVRMPQAFVDMGKQCPNLHIGMAWNKAVGSDPGARPLDWVEPVTEKELTEMYGAPARARRDFALYNIQVGKGVVRPVFFAANGAWFELIDAEKCVKEEMESPAPRYKGARGTGMMHSFLKLKSGTYFLDVDRGGGPSIRITPIPADVIPFRPGPDIIKCEFSGSAPHRP